MMQKYRKLIIADAMFCLLVALFGAMYLQNRYFNNTVHTLKFDKSMMAKDYRKDENVSVRLCVRGYDDKEYASWDQKIVKNRGSNQEKELSFVGSIYELTVKNLTGYVVGDWEADVYFPEQTYLNSGWNGDFNVHQHVGKKEKSFLFKNGKVEEKVNGKPINLDYIMDNTKRKYTNCLYKACSTEKAKCNSGKRKRESNSEK